MILVACTRKKRGIRGIARRVKKNPVRSSLQHRITTEMFCTSLKRFASSSSVRGGRYSVDIRFRALFLCGEASGSGNEDPFAEIRLFFSSGVPCLEERNSDGWRLEF